MLPSFVDSFQCFAILVCKNERVTDMRERFFSKNVIVLFLLMLFAHSFVYGIDNPNFSKKKVYSVTTDKNLTEVAKILHSVSSLEGIQYYSNTHEKWETLYHKAGFIAHPDNQKFLLDGYYSGTNKTYYCLLDDNSLGDCVFKINYLESSTALDATFTIVRPITFMGITGISPNNLVIQLTVTKTDNTLQFTIKIDAQYQTISFLESKLEKSLNARLDALYKWFVEEISR